MAASHRHQQTTPLRARLIQRVERRLGLGTTKPPVRNAADADLAQEILLVRRHKRRTHCPGWTNTWLVSRRCCGSSHVHNVVAGPRGTERASDSAAAFRKPQLLSAPLKRSRLTAGARRRRIISRLNNPELCARRPSEHRASSPKRRPSRTEQSGSLPGTPSSSSACLPVRLPLQLHKN